MSIDRRSFLALSGAATASLAFESPPAQSRELSQLTLAEVAELLRRKEVSPVDLTRACLARIEKHNPALSAYITVRADEALAEARMVESDLQRGTPRGPLHGIPIALKDNIDTAGVRTTGASDLFRDRVPTDDADVARRLKQAGTILLGKLNLHEFAYGGSSTVTAYGAMHNPWKLDRVTGGSSGGPAVAVAAGLCYGSLGTDTAGSVRMPASHCGIVGLKPTYGRVSTRGVMTLSWTLDHVGPMCKSVEDVALMMNVVAGYDPLDPATADVAVPDYRRALGAATSTLRLAIPRTPFFDNLDPEVASAMTTALDVLRGMTASISDVPPLPASGNPARVWSPEAYAYHSKWITESPEKYQPGTRATLQRSATLNAAEYAQAVHDVQVARREILPLFTKVDLLVTPTMKTPAPPLEGGAPGGGGNNNAVFDVFGLPTISVPCGFTTAGLPIGMQISGAPWAEPTVLALAYAYEQATSWHTRRPPL
jgi:aspartyl-tRNA(Asn)/glutamyl-tRNA(Gln) amidotransferase subunit A